jgi:tetratricopeptide (TPR) repeat protein
MSYNRGTLALQKGNYEKALQFFKREKVASKELYLNMGNTYRMLGMNAKAWECYFEATKFDSGYVEAISNMGLLAYQEGSDTLACKFYNTALRIDPLHVKSVWNYSLALLREYCSGGALDKDAWKMHEYRFKAVKAIGRCALEWDGSYVEKLVVLTEQGYGDKLMYSRYLDLVAAKVGELWVQCPVDMAGLYKYKTCQSIEDFEVGIPIGNLAAMFGVVDGKWIDCKFSVGDKLLVAVEWQGSRGHLNDRNRSCYGGYFSKLAKSFPMVEFINIRPNAESIRGVKRVDVNDWAASVAEIEKCDLVISIDTSLVHLAGSMGKECWLMQPLCDTDFRWGNPITKASNGIDIESNIWYSSVRVLENIGWEEMFKSIEERLRKFASDWETRKWLNGYTVEEFVEEYKKQLDDKH